MSHQTHFAEEANKIIALRNVSCPILPRVVHKIMFIILLILFQGCVIAYGSKSELLERGMELSSLMENEGNEFTVKDYSSDDAEEENRECAEGELR